MINKGIIVLDISLDVYHENFKNAIYHRGFGKKRFYHVIIRNKLKIVNKNLF
jgi:hypothetical protein